MQLFYLFSLLLDFSIIFNNLTIFCLYHTHAHLFIYSFILYDVRLTSGTAQFYVFSTDSIHKDVT